MGSAGCSAAVSSPQFQLDTYRTASAAGWLPWLLFTVVVMAPIGEETLFRGFLFRGWHRSPRDIWPVIVVTAMLWAVVHLQYDPYGIKCLPAGWCSDGFVG